AGLDEAIDIGGVPVDDPVLSSPSSMIQNEVRRAQDSLRVLSEQTGGFAIVNQNDFNTGFQRIIEENSSYYVLGYYPTNDKRDGKLRKITIKVNGYTDAQLSFRKRYAAPRGKGPKNTMAGKPVDPAAGLTAELMAAIASPLPK